MNWATFIDFAHETHLKGLHAGIKTLEITFGEGESTATPASKLLPTNRYRFSGFSVFTSMENCQRLSHTFSGVIVATMPSGQVMRFIVLFSCNLEQYSQENLTLA